MSVRTMELESIKNQIENMDTTHHVEILKIIKKNANIKLNENKSGIFINLSFIPADTIQEIRNYLNYIYVQENVLLSTEIQKEEYKKTFFNQSEEYVAAEQNMA